MKIEKLMEILKGTEEVVFRINGLGEEVYTTKEIHECIEPIHEKQVAKKPIKSTFEHDCTNCNTHVAYGDEYCWKCGQKIDWSEE